MRPPGSENPYKQRVFAIAVLARTDPDASALVYNWCTEGVYAPL